MVKLIFSQHHKNENNIDSLSAKKTVRFIHTADWHLGSKTSIKKSSGQDLFFKAELKLDSLLKLSQENDVDFWLLAGDIIESSSLDTHTIEQLSSIFQQASVPIFIACGNHDPLTPQSVWQTVNWPENVHIFSNTGDFFVLPALKVVCYGASFAHQYEKNFLWQDNAAFCEELASIKQTYPPHEEWTYLACLHGQVVSEQQSSVYHPINPEKLFNFGFSYIALGHLHTQKLVKATDKSLALYSTCLFSRGFKDGAVSGLFLVDIIATDDFSYPGSYSDSYPGSNSGSYSSASSIKQSNVNLSLKSGSPNLLDVKFNKEESYFCKKIAAHYLSHPAFLFCEENVKINNFTSFAEFIDYLNQLSTLNNYRLYLGGTAQQDLLDELFSKLPFLKKNYPHIDFYPDNISSTQLNPTKQLGKLGEMIDEILAQNNLDEGIQDAEISRRTRELLYSALTAGLNEQVSSPFGFVEEFKQKWAND